MRGFLWWVGLYNLLGALALPLFAHKPGWADAVLRRWIEVTRGPYDHGAHGALWVWWAATVNGFLGAVMLLAPRWEESAQREVAWAVVAVYGVMWAVAVGALWSPRYSRRGLYAVVLLLWPLQMGWGLWALLG